MEIILIKTRLRAWSPNKNEAKNFAGNVSGIIKSYLNIREI